MSPKAILFDLDGTLIDSARTILAGFERALEREGLQAVVPLEPSLIGPPLPKTLATLAGTSDPCVIARLAIAYREAYDGGGYLQTEVYPGVPAMIEALATQRIALHIVTNKRIAPTRLILDHLGWTRWFRGIYALDALEPAAPHKSALVSAVMQLESLTQTHTWMVGDSAEDRSAAESNGLRFFSATWGYGAAGADGLRSPGDLLLRFAHHSA
ncbi:MAG: HAD family hydrolase [Gammaproteobacteria bacterium]|nr:HAD family hydrolase [Gammaproteobacteria bacterium]